MTRPYSNDLRERVMAAVTAGRNCRVVAERFDIAVSSVVKWSQRYPPNHILGSFFDDDKDATLVQQLMHQIAVRDRKLKAIQAAFSDEKPKVRSHA